MSTTGSTTTASSGEQDASGAPVSSAPLPPDAAEHGGVAHGADTIATLREGDAVDAVFACVRKERLTARSGTPYLTVELRDRSGSVAGRVFRDADLLAGRFERGELCA